MMAKQNVWNQNSLKMVNLINVEHYYILLKYDG